MERTPVKVTVFDVRAARLRVSLLMDLGEPIDQKTWDIASVKLHEDERPMLDAWNEHVEKQHIKPRNRRNTSHKSR